MVCSSYVIESGAGAFTVLAPLPPASFFAHQIQRVRGRGRPPPPANNISKSTTISLFVSMSTHLRHLPTLQHPLHVVLQHQLATLVQHALMRCYHSAVGLQRGNNWTLALLFSQIGGGDTGQRVLGC